MATIKTIPDTYDIYVPTMTVHGNLNVVGNTTNINSTTIDVDNTLVFNANLRPVFTMIFPGATPACPKYIVEQWETKEGPKLVSSALAGIPVSERFP